MKNIKLTEEQKKVFEKYNLYLTAVLGDSGVGWNSYIYYDDGMDNLDGPTIRGNRGWERRDELMPENPGYDILCEIADEIVRSNEERFYDYLDDDYARTANVDLYYNPETKTFKLGLVVYVRKEDYSEKTKTFSELVDEQEPWYAANQNRLYKKLKDDSFVQKLIDEHGGETNFEFPYNGFGDSGQIDSNLSYNDEKLGVAYELIDLYYGGWENNEGGDGTVLIDLESKVASIYHTNFYEDEVEEEIEEFQIV